MSAQTSSFEKLYENGFIDLPEPLVRQGARKTLVYVLIQRHEPTVATILLEEYGLSEGTVYPALKELEADGLVESSELVMRPSVHEYVTTGPKLEE
jgi:DNA-binding PadR family transcriptional regulator